MGRENAHISVFSRLLVSELEDAGLLPVTCLPVDRIVLMVKPHVFSSLGKATCETSRHVADM